VPVEHAIWHDQLTAAERAQLAPRLESLPRHADVLVVGGGMLGLASAAQCQRAGLGRVVLLERQHLAAGASGGSAGMLVPAGHAGIDPPWFVDLQHESLRLWRELDATWPGGVGLLELDWLGLDPRPPVDPASLRPAAAQHLDAQAIHARLPELAEPRGGLLVGGQARLNPLRAAAWLGAGLEATATGVTALGVDCQGGRVVAVETSAGRIEVGAVLFATGGPPHLDGLDLRVPAGFVKGHLLVTEPAALPWSGFVTPLATQIEDGRLLVGGSLDVGDNSPEVRPEVIATLWSGLTSQLTRPAAAGLRISHQWVCFRP